VSGSPFSAISWVRSSNSANCAWRNTVPLMLSSVSPRIDSRVRSSLVLFSTWSTSRASLKVEATSATKIG